MIRRKIQATLAHPSEQLIWTFWLLIGLGMIIAGLHLSSNGQPFGWFAWVAGIIMVTLGLEATIVGVHPITVGAEREVREALWATIGFAFASSVAFASGKLTGDSSGLFQLLTSISAGATLIAGLITGLELHFHLLERSRAV